MRIYGLVKTINNHKRIYGIITKYKIYYIYFKRSLHQTFKNYLVDNNLIDLEVTEPVKKDNYYVYVVYYVSKIKSLALDKVYYSEELNNKSLKKLFKSIKNVLILDLEMLMPPYNYKGNFMSEIVEMGYVLYDENDKLKLKYDAYLKANQELNDRTANFLKWRKRDYYRNAISFYKAYNELKKVLKKYHPTIIVYGKNDILALKRTFINYKLPNLLNYIRIINLSSLIENYYHHVNELGLFNLYNMYYDKNDSQQHGALSDAIYTYYVYRAFKTDILNGQKSI